MSNPTDKNPLFQRRHLKEIARILSKFPDHAPTLRAAKESAIATFADNLANSNTSFDRSRFVAAANGSPINWRDEQRSS